MAQADQVKFVLRLPPSLHRKIKRRAKSSNTSMNREITNILSVALGSGSVEDMLDDLVKRLEKKKVI